MSRRPHARRTLASALTLAVAALVALMGQPRPAHAEVSLAFGVYASDKPSAMVRQFRPVLDVLQDKLSRLLGEPVKIKLQVARTYEQGIANLVEGRVDFARLGPASYIEAKAADPGISILVVESNNGSKEFKGIIAVAKDSPIQRVEDLAGKRFAFGDKRSTIGRYLSQLYLLKHGIRASDLGSFDYLGRHDAVGAAVGSRLFDAGALKESTFDKLVEGGVALRAIGSFPNATKPWIARRGLSENIQVQLRAALKSITDNEALQALSKDGFVDGRDSDYAVIREAIQRNHLFFRDSQQAVGSGG